MSYNNKRLYTKGERTIMIHNFSQKRLARIRAKEEYKESEWLTVVRKLYKKMRYGNDLNHFEKISTKYIQEVGQV